MEQPSNLFDLQLDQTALNYLNESARWARFLAIIGFITCGFMVIGGFLYGSDVANQFASLSGEGFIVGKGVLSFIYIFIALILFFPCLYLFNFSSKMRKAFRGNDQPVLSDALKNLKSFFKFYGIFTIIMLSIYALALFAAIIGAVVGSRH
jgi:Family of unknown function (DUF5362)